MKKKSILTALFAALVCAGCFIQIPMPVGVPIVIQDMMSMLSGMMLGPLYGTIAVFIFLILGIIGLPVFSGKAGIAIILYGPTGGFLIGYLLSAFIAGLVMQLFLGNKILQKNKANEIRQWVVITVAGLLATVVVFLCGILGFMRITQKTFIETLPLVLIPFLPGNAVKLVLMVLLTKKIRPTIINLIK